MYCLTFASGKDSDQPEYLQSEQFLLSTCKNLEPWLCKLKLFRLLWLSRYIDWSESPLCIHLKVLFLIFCCSLAYVLFSHSSIKGLLFFFCWKILIFFLFLHENICCGYSLEAPRWGASNENPQFMFSWRNKKNVMWILLLIWSRVHILLWFENESYYEKRDMACM